MFRAVLLEILIQSQKLRRNFPRPLHFLHWKVRLDALYDLDTPKVLLRERLQFRSQNKQEEFGVRDCSPSTLMRQKGGVEEGRNPGSS
jgi:hypothetical protein